MVLPSGVIVGAVVAKTAGSLSIFLGVEITTGQKRKVIHSFHNGYMKADRSCTRLPSLTGSPVTHHSESEVYREPV